MMPKAPMSMPKPGGMPTGAGPMSAPSAGAVGAPSGGSPEEVRAAIMAVLQRAKSLADKFGLDLNELVAELGGSSGRASAPPPPMSGGMPPGMMG